MRSTWRRSAIARATYLPDAGQLWWILGWCLAAFCAFYTIDNQFFFAILLLPMGAVALGLLVSGLWRGWELRCAPIAALLTAFLMPTTIACVPYLGRSASWLYFLQDRGAYEEIINQVESSRLHKSAESQFAGIEYRIDRSEEATRIAFVTNQGVVDNWAAVIHDPTDAVARAQGHHTAPRDVQQLLGGNLVSCWKLSGHFYSCNFS